MDPSLEPNPRLKGGYYFGCEKIARGIVGIYKQWDADKAYAHNTRLKLKQIKKAAAAMGLKTPSEDIDWIFADHDEQKKLPSTSACKYSARHLRNRASHEIGPSNVEQVTKHVRFHNPRMKVFLASVPTIHPYLRDHRVP